MTRRQVGLTLLVVGVILAMPAMGEIVRAWQIAASSADYAPATFVVRSIDVVGAAGRGRSFMAEGHVANEPETLNLGPICRPRCDLDALRARFPRGSVIPVYRSTRAPTDPLLAGGSLRVIPAALLDPAAPYRRPVLWTAAVSVLPIIGVGVMLSSVRRRKRDAIEHTEDELEPRDRSV